MSCEQINPMYDEVDECLKISCQASSSAVMIYDLIREVGRGELTAHNALHQMIEGYHTLSEIAKEASALAEALKKKEGAK